MEQQYGLIITLKIKLIKSVTYTNHNNSKTRALLELLFY